MLGTATLLSHSGIELWFASFAKTRQGAFTLGRIGLAAPYVIAALIGILAILSVKGQPSIKTVGWGVVLGGGTTFALVAVTETIAAAMLASPSAGSFTSRLDIYSLGGSATALMVGLFGLRVAVAGNAAFPTSGPKTVKGRRAIHGNSRWLTDSEAAELFPTSGGIVIGERYRVDKDSAAATTFDPQKPETWGKGGTAPILGFDCRFGSTHGIVFAGSGGFKTTSVVIPTALNCRESMVVLDPSTEIAPMVAAHRVDVLGQKVYTLDPRNPDDGFNVLDWIGQHGTTAQEDIATVAAWLMSEKPKVTSQSDDFFRTMGEQLIVALIADVVLSDHPDPDDETITERSLRVVRARLAQPEKTLQEKLRGLYDKSTSRFVKEVIAPFTNMSAQTFSGVYATAAKETHWLSYDNYAALVSGSKFTTKDFTETRSTVFLNIDLATLENHPGMARVMIGAFLKSIYNRNGKIEGRTVFLLDEAARLGYMRIIETARDAGRKYGITLLMLFQSIGQMREAFGGADATSKWFESASWVSFAAINDPETARYISDRCGVVTVEVDQVSRSTGSSSGNVTRSRQLAQRALIMPHEVTQMRTDEQIIFTSSNPPLRAGRAMYFRRPEMRAVVGTNRFHAKGKT